MNTTPPSADTLHHHSRQMRGRDRHEAHRVATPLELLFQWLRAARQDPARRRACLTYAMAVSVAQIGWVALIFVHFSAGVTVILFAILFLMELAGPAFAERKDGGTPWHAHHIAERHSLFAIIALGEGVVGTVAALSAVVEQQGWTMDAALVGIADTGSPARRYFRQRA